MPRRQVAYFGNLAKAFADVADGLQHAHSKGVTHRDIKPSNLILDADGRLRILDFGLARLEGQESLTLSGDFVGTPLYMSPEQARRKKISVDHRTDVYSLGATMYEAICGRPPFCGKDHADTLSQIIEREPVDPRKANPRVPTDLETIVLKCLRKDAGERYGTAEAVAQDLRRLVRGDPIEARPLSPWEKVARHVWNHRRKVIATLVMVVLLATVGGLALKVRRDERARRETEYGPTILNALQKMDLAHFAGSDAVRHEFGLRPWGYSILSRELSLELTERAGMRPVEEAIAGFSAAARSLPERADAYWYRARAELLLGDEEAALADLDRALERLPDLVPAAFLKASILGRRGEAGEAAAIREAAEELAPPWGKLWLQAQRYSQRGRLSKAAEAFRRAIAAIAGLDEPHVGWQAEIRFSRAYMLAMDDPVEALKELAILGLERPGAIEVQIFEGFAHQELASKFDGEQAKRANEYFEKAYHDTPYKDEVAFLIQYWMVFQFNEVEAAYRWAERIQSPALRECARALQYDFQGRDAKCIRTLRRAIKLEPESTYARRELVVSLQGIGRADEALPHVRVLVGRYPDDPRWQARLGWSLQAVGDKEGARRACDAAVRLRPTEAQIFRIVGHVRFLVGDHSRAWTDFEMGAKLDAHGRVLYTWGGDLMEAKRWEEALVKFDKAVGQNQKHNWSNLHARRGQALEKLKRFDEAIEAYGEGEDLNDDGDLRDSVFRLHNLVTGEDTNLGLALRPYRGSFVRYLLLSDDWLAVLVSESSQGEDLNGDGDTEDLVVHAHNLSTGETTNLGLVPSWTRTSKEVALPTPHFQIHLAGDWLVISVSESEQGENLNGDGDLDDSVLHTHDLATGESANLGLAPRITEPDGDARIGLSGDRLAFSVSEIAMGEDLNDDGDTEDDIVHIHRLSTGETTSTNQPARVVFLSDDWLVLRVLESSRGEDLNGDGDTDDLVQHLIDLAALFSVPIFRRGDCNGDGTVDISDAVSTLASLFLGEGAPGCDDACDSNDDGAVDISDAVATLGVLFLGQGIIPPPGMTECGVDPTDDALGCERSKCSLRDRPDER